MSCFEWASSFILIPSGGGSDHSSVVIGFMMCSNSVELLDGNRRRFAVNVRARSITMIRPRTRKAIPTTVLVLGHVAAEAKSFTLWNLLQYCNGGRILIVCVLDVGCTSKTYY